MDGTIVGLMLRRRNNEFNNIKIENGINYLGELVVATDTLRTR